MPLRKSPVRTAALLAASRTNGCKSHGPKTLRGKARASLNALKTGRYVVQLRRKLVDAGDREGEALYARLRPGWPRLSAPAGGPSRPHRTRSTNFAASRVSSGASTPAAFQGHHPRKRTWNVL